MQFDRFQQAAIDEIVSGSGNLVIKARSGAGKTSTLIEAVGRLGQYRGSVLLCAFSKDVQKELKARAPAWADVFTTHQLGLRALGRRFGKVEVDPAKGRKIVWRVVRSLERKRSTRYRTDLSHYVPALLKLVALSKSTLVRSVDEIEQLALSHGVADKTMPAQALAAAVVECMQIASTEPNRVDFDDMLYLIEKLDISPDRYDYVFVDELQDFTPAQINLTKRLSRGRIISIGDEKQAIFSWRGADSGAMQRMVYETSAKELPLSVTYRCPIAVVDFVRKLVPDIEPRPGAPIGEVTRKTELELLAQARQGDFVLSRTNAPLIGVCLELLKRRIPAVVAGKDIGWGLVDLIERSKANSVSELEMWLTELLETEQAEAKIASEFEREARDVHLSSLTDQIDAIRAVATGETRIIEVINTLNSMFSDETDNAKLTSVVVCSTVHRAKGRERDRVWLLSSTFRRDAGEEEDNIFYVACTRARFSLFLVQPTAPRSAPQKH